MRLPWPDLGFLTRRFSRAQIAVVVILVVLLLLLYGSLWLSRASVPALIGIMHQNSKLMAQDKTLEQRNQQLYRKIVALRNSNQVVEGIARSQLGLIQKDEEYYFVVYKPLQPEVPQADEAETTAPATPAATTPVSNTPAAATTDTSPGTETKPEPEFEPGPAAGSVTTNTTGEDHAATE